MPLADPPAEVAAAETAPAEITPAGITSAGLVPAEIAPAEIAPAEIFPAGVVLAGIGDEAGPGLDEQVAAVSELGWRRLELRAVGGVPLARLGEQPFAAAVERIAAAGISVVCVASKIGDWSRPVTGDFALDLTELNVLARRCPALGTRLVRVMSYPSGGLPDAEWARLARARLRELARRAEDSGLLLVHENCAGWAADRADRMLDLITGIGSPALRLLFDTGNGVPYGYPSVPMLRDIVEYVAHVHVKDAVTAGDGTVGYVPPGEGESEVGACLSLLLAHGYRGALSIEPHLHLRPHLATTPAGTSADTTPGRGDRAAFVAYGRALEGLLTKIAGDAQ
ncbi:TIM barrel protein [Nonomuraea sp. NPDC050404]|uniref:sugar phosphate isomerase/epimerase family protein n=1 Tax=Nonomuraea sp. NPDC050404 TaxID=3155783 RepID=UPI0033EBCA8B